VLGDPRATLDSMGVLPSFCWLNVSSFISSYHDRYFNRSTNMLKICFTVSIPFQFPESSVAVRVHPWDEGEDPSSDDLCLAPGPHFCTSWQ
jgi:hypothetical protein